MKRKKLPEFKPSDIKPEEFFPQETKIVNGKISYGRVIQIPEQFTVEGLETLYQILEDDDIHGRPDDGLGRRQALFIKSCWLQKGVELPDVGESRIEVMNFLVNSQGIIDTAKAKKPAEPETTESDKTWYNAEPVTLTVATQNYHVERGALKKRIKNKTITDYRIGKTGLHLVKLPDVSNWYPPRK